MKMTENNIAILIDEYKKTLRSCAHCGSKGATIYYVCYMNEKDPHCFQVVCHGTFNEEDGMILGCGMRTRVNDAADTEENIREALEAACNNWNRRPGEWESNNFDEENK